MLKCEDRECGWEGERNECALDLETDLTEPYCVDLNNNTEFNIDVSITLCCPDCGESLGVTLTGETYFTVELGES